MKNSSVVMVYDHYYPDFSAGGPITSLANLEKLTKANLSVNILTSSIVYHSKKEIIGVKKNEWTTWNNTPVWYASNRRSIKTALKSLPLDSTIYLNGVFSIWYFIYPLWLSNRFRLKVVISPRGMLQHGALKKRYWKKKIFIELLKTAGLFKKVVWHATDRQEADDIDLHIGHSQRVTIIPNVPRLSRDKIQSIEKIPGVLKLVYFSLIAEKKNLSFILELLRLTDLNNIELNIIGPIKDKVYWQECLKVISNIPNSGRVIYHGEINPSGVEETISQYHVLVLPTHGENFGHAIVETLACGRPVLISDKTPWNDVGQYHAGYSLPLDFDAWHKALKEMRDWGQHDFDNASASALNYYRMKFDFDDLKTRYLELFSNQI
ncbi:MAG TPA: glycosyltransferase [Cyclobacteriaceae bacterium]|jgi:glycosyltransferase involved in cell wall biosynthesis|nr:glycosyltransferase [Cyclobacteriaceae bacterium]